MVEVLKIINSEMKKLDIDYQFGVWKTEIKYPMTVGNFAVDEYVYENNCTKGTFTLHTWNGGSEIELTKMADRIKKQFAMLIKSNDNASYRFAFNNTINVPTGADDLYRIDIIIDVTYWEV